MGQKWMCLRRGFAYPCLVSLAAVSLAIVGMRPALAQSDDEDVPKVSDAPLSAEQLVVYRAVLSGWIDTGRQSIHLANVTVPLDLKDDPCGKKAPALEPDSSLVHRFRKEDIPRLAAGNLDLVDPDAQQDEIAQNDPSKAIREGKPVDEAVRNGFNHGLVTLSEVRFDPTHKLAVIGYGFRCGGKCGNGGTVVMEKRDNVWRRKDVCSVWMAKLDFPLSARPSR